MKLNTLSAAVTAAWMAFLLPMGAIAAAPADAPHPTDFNGSWQEDAMEDDSPIDHFRLDLIEKNGHICGTHFASTNHQNDISLRDGITVTGIVKGATGIIDINDGNYIYHGTIAFHGAELRWTRQTVTPIPHSALFSPDAVWPLANMDKAYDRPDFLDTARRLCGEASAK